MIYRYIYKSITIRDLSWSRSSVVFTVYFRLLPCWKVNYSPSLRSCFICSRFSWRTFLCLVEFILPSVLTSLPVPAAWFSQDIVFGVPPKGFNIYLMRPNCWQASLYWDGRPSSKFSISAEDFWSSVRVALGFLVSSLLAQLLSYCMKSPGSRPLLFQSYWGHCDPRNTQTFGFWL